MVGCKLRWIALIFAMWGTAAAPQGTACVVDGVTIEGVSSSDTENVCDRIETAITTLASCNLPVPTPLTVRITDQLPDDCLGIFHCGQSLIELPRASVMVDRLLPDSPFRALSPSVLFDSVVRHELTHAAYDGAPCPYDHCDATAEYLAYAMQIRYLPPAELAAFVARIDRPGRVRRDDISTMILNLAPNTFAQRSYQHLSQRPDPCAYVGLIMQGDIVFDFVPF